MRHVLVHDYYQIEPREVWKVIRDNLQPLREQVTRYLEDVDWDEWEKNEVVITETAAHKTLMQTARRMKKDDMTTQQISRYTGLTAEEIEGLNNIGNARAGSQGRKYRRGFPPLRYVVLYSNL